MALFKLKYSLDPEGRTEYYLPTDMAGLEKFFTLHESRDGVYGLDTEASSLNTHTAELAGISVAPNPEVGIYIPVGHLIPINLELTSVIGLLKDFDKGKKAQLYNAKYDITILNRTANFNPETPEDVMVSVHLDNPDRLHKDLKNVALQTLGFKMLRFEDLFTADEIRRKDFDIRRKNTRSVVAYASADADATLRLYYHFKHIQEEFSGPYQVDQILWRVIMEMEDLGGWQFDPDYLASLADRLPRIQDELRSQIMETVGYQFELDSPKQLGNALFGHMGLPNVGLTEKGQYKTGEDDLAQLENRYPVVALVVMYRKVTKAIGTYLKKMQYLEERGISPRFSFMAYGAPTYRLSAPGGSPKTDGHSGLNIQAVSNGELRTMSAVVLERKDDEEKKIDLMDDEALFQERASPATDLLDEDLLGLEELTGMFHPHIMDVVTGEKVCIRSSCEGCSTKCVMFGSRREQVKEVMIIPSMRNAFVVPKGYLIVGGDYDRQELVIGANMSGETVWLDAMLRGEDIHMVTGMEALGISDVTSLSKEMRKMVRGVGKVLNFATFYGATPYTIARNTGLPIDEAEKVYNTFRSKLRYLFGWIAENSRFARRNGYVKTYFGRRRWLKQIYEKGDKRMIAFGDRSATNTRVQGCLQEGALVLTNSGLIKIGEMWRSDKTYKVWTGFKWADATAVNRGPCQLAEIEFTDGTVIHCDTRHKMKGSDNQWMDFEDMKAGSLLAKAVLPDVADEINWERLGFEVYGYGEIKEIRVLDRVEDTYTLSVNDPLHQFTADGFIHKNTGADVTRIAMVRSYNYLKANQVDPDQARLILSLHDELLFMVREDLLDPLGFNLVRKMMFPIKNWKVQLNVEPKVGGCWGKLEKTPFPEVSQ